jgi:hypothetical protein
MYQIEVVAFQLDLPLNEAESLHAAIVMLGESDLLSGFDIEQATVATIALKRLNRKLGDAIKNPRVITYRLDT